MAASDTIFGWDASDYDYGRGSMDLGAARADGIDFATFKITEGTHRTHVNGGRFLTGMRDHGTPFLGGYMVPRTPGNGGNGSVAQQVDFFLSAIDRLVPWLPTYPGRAVQVDTEHWGDPVYDAVPAWVGREAASRLRDRGWPVLHYCPKWSYGKDDAGPYPLWASNYGTNPIAHYRELYPGNNSPRWGPYGNPLRTPSILQYGSKTIIGTQHTCDANAFRGSLTDFARLLGASAPVTPDADTEGEDTMFIAKDDKGNYYLCDGMTSRPISAADANQIAYCSSSGYGTMYDLRHGDPAKNPANGTHEWEDVPGGQSWVKDKRHVRIQWGAPYCGPVGAPVTMSDADITKLAGETAAQIDVPAGATKEEIAGLLNSTRLMTEGS